MSIITWIGIFVCLSQSAMFSGLNLAFFSISKLRLELEAGKNNKDALTVLGLRHDANFLLVTILWGNVAVNVLLALLSGSVLTGVSAFLFSTVVITILGEIVPQAYFTRHAIAMAARLSPVIKMYQLILYPVAKPTALILDAWLGKEGIAFYLEEDLQELIKMHMETTGTEINSMEGQGALNFLDLDDLPLAQEGELLDPKSVIPLAFEKGQPVFPAIDPRKPNDFLRDLLASQKKWVVLVDSMNEPRLVLNTDRFIREALQDPRRSNPLRHCHKPIVIKDEHMTLDSVIPRFRVHPQHGEDDVIDEDIVLLWGEEKKIMTGSDLLGRLLRGIVRNRAIEKSTTVKRER